MVRNFVVRPLILIKEIDCISILKSVYTNKKNSFTASIVITKVVPLRPSYDTNNWIPGRRQSICGTDWPSTARTQYKDLLSSLKRFIWTRDGRRHKGVLGGTSWKMWIINMSFMIIYTHIIYFVRPLWRRGTNEWLAHATQHKMLPKFGEN